MPVQDLSNVSWHPRGDRIAGASYDGRSVVLVPATGQVHKLEPPERGAKHPRELVGVVWNGDSVCVARADGTVVTWSSPRDSSVHGAHDGAITSVEWCPLRRRLATCGTDDTVLVADHRGGLVRLQCDDTPMAVRWHPSGDRLAIGLGDGRVLVWDHRQERAGWDRQAHPSCCSCVAWSPRGDLLLTGGHDGAVRQWKPTP
ncbi:MAG: WD40 repeat domain-containing protein [Acidimicrobiia bacterium]